MIANVKLSAAPLEQVMRKDPQFNTPAETALLRSHGGLGGTVEGFGGEAGMLSYPNPTARDLASEKGPSFKNFSMYENPPQAPKRVQMPNAAPLPAGKENYMDPQVQGGYMTEGPDESGGWRTFPPKATVPYPIRGAGRMGAIPTLPDRPSYENPPQAPEYDMTDMTEGPDGHGGWHAFPRPKLPTPAPK